jgi:hypothetical protein
MNGLGARWRPLIGLGLVLAIWACEDTRFVGVKTQVDTFVQEGEEVVDLFTQGGVVQIEEFAQDGYHQVDTFKQRAAAQVDIMWVVDNSATMQGEQDNLAANFDSFIAFIDESQIDYHIGVISSDMDDATHSGALLGDPTIITRDLGDPAAAFSANIKVGISGGGNEQGLLAAHEALSNADLLAGANAGFLREEASLAVVFVSDEDDFSPGGVEYYGRFFTALKGVGNEGKIKIGAIVGPDSEAGEQVCEDGGFYASAGTRYLELVTMLGGTSASICTDDFSTTLQQLGLTVAGLSRRFELSRIPDPGGIVVRVDDPNDGEGFVQIPQDSESGWRLSLEEKAIYFDGDYVPPPQADIEVEYGNVDNAFELSGRGDPTTLKVSVDEDGEGPQEALDMVEGEDWAYDSPSNTVVFAFDYVPPLGAVIQVSYANLESTFSLSRAVENPETLRVEVDRKDGSGFRTVLKDDANGWMYHAESNSILFQGTFLPPDQSEIKVAYSNLGWLFPLTLKPRANSLIVLLDPDGDGGQAEAEVPKYDEGSQTAGWLYYGPDEEAPYTNSISFEKMDWPPLGGRVTVTYLPGVGS